MTQTFNEPVIVNDQLKVPGGASQTQQPQIVVQEQSGQTKALQEWQKSDGTPLAQVVPEGRLRIGGNLTLGTPSAILEANKDIPNNPPVGTVKQGWQSRGIIRGALSQAVAWIVHELELKGEGGIISSVHAALRTKFTHSNTNGTNPGNSTNADLRAGDFEGVNQSGTSGVPVGQLSGLKATVTNEPSAYLSKAAGVKTKIHNQSGATIVDAVGVEVEAATNQGTINNLYGVKVADVTQGANNYALHTGYGRVHIGDLLQLRVPPTLPMDAPDGTVFIFPKSNGSLYAVNDAGLEMLLSSGGTPAGSASLTTTGTAGETLVLRDVVYLKNDNKWYKVDIDAIPIKISDQIGIVTAIAGIATNNQGEITLLGRLSGLAGLTIGAPIYASTTPGQVTQSRPTVLAGTGQKIILPLGIALSASEVFFAPRAMQILKREVLAANETVTLQHPSDPLGRRRNIKAFMSGGGTSSVFSYPYYFIDSRVDLRKLGSSDLTGTGTASESAYYPNYPGSQAFDNSTDYINSVWAVASTTAWLKYDFGVSTPRVVIRYTLRGQATLPQRSPKNWTFEGSNDNTNWVVLDTRTNQTSWAGQNIYDISNTTAYRYYRINITANNGEAYTCISEMELIGDENRDKIAQSFQLSANQLLRQIRLYLQKAGSPTGTLTLRIETDNAGKPSGSLAHANATTTLSESQLGTSWAWFDFDFSNIALNATTTYWMVLSTSRAASSADYVSWGADGSAPNYTGGEMKSEGGGLWITENKDAGFEVLVAETNYEEPCVVGRWSGGTRDIAVQFGDGTGANTDTHTTFKNVIGATVDVTAVVELS